MHAHTNMYICIQHIQKWRKMFLKRKETKSWISEILLSVFIFRAVLSLEGGKTPWKPEKLFQHMAYENILRSCELGLDEVIAWRGGLNENGPIGSCAWILGPQLVWTVWEGFRGVVSLKEVCLRGAGFEVSKDSGHPRCAICLCALCLLFVGSCVRAQLLLQLPTTRLGGTIMNTSPLGLQTQLNSFFDKFCLLRATENKLRHLTSKIRKTKRAGSISILRFTQLSGFSFICHYMTHRGSAAMTWTWN